MVQVVVLLASGETKNLKTSAFTAQTVTGDAIAHALRKKTPAECVATYKYNKYI